MRRMTTKEFIEKANAVHQGKYSYENAIYTLSKNHVSVTCPTHGSFLVTANNHISAANACGCPECGGTQRLGLKKFIARSYAIHNGTYDYSRVVYTSNSTAVTIICPVHGEFQQTPAKHLIGRGCPSCGGTARRSTAEWISLARAKHADMYSYEQTPAYFTGSDVVNIRCQAHGIFKQVMKHHVNRGYGCPSCGQRSSQEQIIKEYLETLGVTVEQRNRKVIAPKEIDLWLPEYNIGIEYHGLHWHTEDRVGQLHLEKWKLANAAGVRIIQIFEDEWLNKQEIVKSRLCALVGKSEKVFARKTKIKPIEFRTAADFLSQTHIQSAGRAGISYGLYYEGVLVAVAVFGQARTGAMTQRNDGVWEVYRYASIGRVVGGFTKLYKQFIEDIQPTEVISYCDLRYGNGGVYKAAGFVLDGVSPPDYWWVASGKIERIPRYQMQKHKLQTHPLTKEYYVAGMTERQICEAAGLRRIYGVGNQKWVHKLA